MNLDFFNVLMKMEALPKDDYVAFTFFIGYMAMLAASVFFFFEMGSVSKKWRKSLLISALITGIAAVHYYYMRGYWLDVGDSPTFFRYVDWILTVPLMCVEFYLLTVIAGAKRGLLYKLIGASLWMLIMGYIGEAYNPGSGQGMFGHSAIFGILSTIGYLYVLHAAWFGEVAKLAENASDTVKCGVRYLAWFVLAGWAIYPIGYMCMEGGWLHGVIFQDPAMLDVFYNIADAINKIGFGLVVYSIAITESAKEKA